MIVEKTILPKAEAARDIVVSAQRIDLTDPQGRLRIQIGFSKEGPPGIWLMDEKGVARLAFGLYNDGTGHMGIQDKNGQMVQLLRTFGSQEAPLLIFKNQGQDRMILGLNSGTIDPFFISYAKDRKKKVYSEFGDGP